jgi:hypothetical protein
VHGIEVSPDRVEQLRLHVGGAAVDVTLGDFAMTKVVGRGGSFSLAYLVQYCTKMNQRTQQSSKG